MIANKQTNHITAFISLGKKKKQQQKNLSYIVCI